MDFRACLHMLASLTAAVLLSLTGCSMQRIAMGGMADAMSEEGTIFSGDEDPELVGDALPFALKLMESIREGVPEHRGIHLALSRGFVQYAYAWVLWPADKTEDINFRHSQELKWRAHKLFLRANRYALLGLELARPGFRRVYAHDPARALAMFEKEDVPQLYWYAASLAMAVSTGLDDTEMIHRLTEVGRLLERCIELDPDWGDGAVHEALVSYYAAIGESLGGGEARARPHFERAVELSGGRKGGVYLAWAEGFSVKKQDRREFEELCLKALSVNVGVDPAHRLSGVITQRRARWLLLRVGDLFLD